MSTSTVQAQKELIDFLDNNDVDLVTAYKWFENRTSGRLYGSLPRGILILSVFSGDVITKLFKGPMVNAHLANPIVGAASHHFLSFRADTAFSISLILQLGQCTTKDDKVQFVKDLLNGAVGRGPKGNMNYGFGMMVHAALAFSLTDAELNELAGTDIGDTLGAYALPSDHSGIFADTAKQLTTLLGEARATAVAKLCCPDTIAHTRTFILKKFFSSKNGSTVRRLAQCITNGNPNKPGTKVTTDHLGQDHVYFINWLVEFYGVTVSNPIFPGFGSLRTTKSIKTKAKTKDKTKDKTNDKTKAKTKNKKSSQVAGFAMAAMKKSKKIKMAKPSSSSGGSSYKRKRKSGQSGPPLADADTVPAKQTVLSDGDVICAYGKGKIQDKSRVMKALANLHNNNNNKFTETLGTIATLLNGVEVTQLIPVLEVFTDKERAQVNDGRQEATGVHAVALAKFAE